MKGVAWDGVGTPQLEAAKKAGELISDVSIWKKNILENNLTLIIIIIIINFSLFLACKTSN